MSSDEAAAQDLISEVDAELEKAAQALNVAAKVACPHCHAMKSYVVDARRRPSRNAFRRRRQCLACAKRFWTIEVVEP